MKRYALAALAVAFTAPLAISTEAAAQHRGDRYDRDHDRDRDHRRGDRDRRDRDWDNRDDRRDERRAYRDGRRDERRADRWDDRRYNGYSYNGRWYYGPPPRGYHYVRDDRGELLLVGIATGVILGIIASQ
ncbi:MAG TPA: hypothetical protein VM915_16875 [Verrucomicrobiae bacterium]|nr:hypothetical protein [Verrucomicrobiae bacterium]